MYDGMRATGWSGSQLIKGIARVPLFSSIQVGPSHDKSVKGHNLHSLQDGSLVLPAGCYLR